MFGGKTMIKTPFDPWSYSDSYDGFLIYEDELESDDDDFYEDEDLEDIDLETF